MKRVALLLVVSGLALAGCSKKEEAKPCSSDVIDSYNRVLWSKSGSQEQAEFDKEFKSNIGGEKCVAFSILRGEFEVTAASTEEFKVDKADVKDVETTVSIDDSYSAQQVIIEETLVEAPVKKSSATCVVFDSTKEQQVFKMKNVLRKAGENLLLEESSTNGSVQVIAHNQVPSLEIRIIPRVPKYARSTIAVTYGLDSNFFRTQIGDYSNPSEDKDYFQLACHPMQACFTKTMVANRHNGTVEEIDDQVFSTTVQTQIDNSRFQGTFSRNQRENNLEITQYTTDRHTSVKVTEGEQTKIQVVTREGKAFKGVACSIN